MSNLTEFQIGFYKIIGSLIERAAAQQAARGGDALQFSKDVSAVLIDFACLTVSSCRADDLARQALHDLVDQSFLYHTRTGGQA